MKNGKTTILTGSLIAGALLGISNMNADASSLTNYSLLGSGAEIRIELLNASNPSLKTFELSCGDSTKTSTSKTKDAKCGEGKCGEDKHKHTKKTKTTKKTESKKMEK